MTPSRNVSRSLFTLLLGSTTLVTSAPFSQAATPRVASPPPTSATIVPGTLTQGTLKPSLTGGSYASESARLDDFPLTTGGSPSLTFPITLSNANFNGTSFGGTPNTLVAFGTGGGVTLRLTSPVHPVPNAKELGIFTAQMLLSSTGSLFNGNMEAAVLVSPDNLSWYTLTGTPVPSPTTYTATSSPLNAPTLAYNFGTLQRAWSYGAGTPASNLSSLPIADYLTPMPDDTLFNSPTATDTQRKSLSTDTLPEDYAAIFGPSAGGNWFDLSSTGLPEINYLRLNAVNTPTSGGIRLDAIYATPASVPEPATTSLLLIATLTAISHRPRRTARPHMTVLPSRSPSPF